MKILDDAQLRTVTGGFGGFEYKPGDTGSGWMSRGSDLMDSAGKKLRLDDEARKRMRAFGRNAGGTAFDIIHPASPDCVRVYGGARERFC